MNRIELIMSEYLNIDIHSSGNYLHKTKSHNHNTDAQFHYANLNNSIRLIKELSQLWC